jgi:hypothetical protein
MDKTGLTVTMIRVVEVPEVHVNRTPGKITMKLRMQMKKRSL